MDNMTNLFKLCSDIKIALHQYIYSNDKALTMLRDNVYNALCANYPEYKDIDVSVNNDTKEINIIFLDKDYVAITDINTVGIYDAVSQSLINLINALRTNSLEAFGNNYKDFYSIITTQPAMLYNIYKLRENNIIKL